MQDQFDSTENVVVPRFREMFQHERTCSYLLWERALPQKYLLPAGTPPPTSGGGGRDGGGGGVGGGGGDRTRPTNPSVKQIFEPF